jgi:phage baseplate assembly protein gpV
VGLGKLLSFIRGMRNGANLYDVKLDPGGGPNVTSEHFAPPGDDAHPLPGDYVVHVAIQRSGGSAVVGYLDPKNDQKAAAGDKRIYARDGDGASIVELWLKNDGTAVLENENGVVTLAANGDISVEGRAISITGDSISITGPTDINGATISESGEVTTAGGIDLDTHVHGGVTSGTSTTGVPQ